MYYLLSSPLELAFLTWFLGFFFILALKKPYWAVFLILLLHQFYLLKFKIGFVPTNVLEIMVLILFLRKPRFNFPDRTLALATLFLMIGVGLGVLFSSDILKSAGIFKSWFIVPLMFFWSIKDIPNKYKYILKPIFFNGLLLSLGAILFWLQGITIWDGRISFIYQSPNQLAMVLGVALLISERLFLKSSRINLLIIITLAMLLTQSLGGILAVLISLIITKIHLEARLLSVVILVSIILVGVIPWLNIDVKDFLPSLDSRFVIWRSAGMILKDNPIFGIGPGMFQETYLQYQKFFSPYPEWAVPHSHNVLLSFWLEGGLLGLMGFIIIIYWFFRESETRHRLNLSNVGFLIMIFFLIFGLADTTYWKNDLALIFWSILALI